MRSSLWDIQERKKLIVSSIEMFKNVLKRKRTQLIVQEAVQISYGINNLQKENPPRAGVVWIGQVDGGRGLVQREHSRPEEESGKDLEGGMSRVSEGTLTCLRWRYSKTPGNEGKSLLTFKTRVHHFKR